VGEGLRGEWGKDENDGMGLLKYASASESGYGCEGLGG